ncbi:MAG: hypothetical protein WEG40_06355 [Candidatus Rokuibacteriota bacterium]
MTLRPDLRARFQAAIRRGLARADREQAAEMARIRPARRPTAQDRGRVHDAITTPRARRPAAAREEDT